LNEKVIFSSHQLLLGLKKFSDNGGYVRIGQVYDNFRLPEKLETRSSLFDFKSFCLVVNKKENSVYVSINGEWIKTNFDVKLIQNLTILPGSFKVGKYIGKMTDLNVWNKALLENSTREFSTGVDLIRFLSETK
jgi:hypothetical protein